MGKWLNIFSICIPVLISVLMPAPVNNRVVFLSIGQGDSTLIQYHGVNILIDGGPIDNVVYKLEKYLGLGVGQRRIDLVILTHPHADHIDGILHLIKRNDIGGVVVSSVCGWKYSETDISVLLEGTQLFSVQSGSHLEEGDVILEYIWPIDQSGDCDSNLNNQSISFILEVGGHKFLFTGDAESSVEKILISSQMIEVVDIMQGGHHCSDTSNTYELLSAIKPELVVCSTGLNNRYGHPSPKVVDRFERLGIDYVDTSIHGDYIVKLE